MHFLLAAGAAPPFFAEIAALIIAGAAIAYVCNRFGIVPIVGFLVAGVVIGPMGLGLVRDQALVDAAAEVGVILLLFTIGIEFSLEKLARIQKLIFGGGGLQVGLASLTTMGLLMLFGVSWQASLFTGFLVALSSTAIVLKLLGDAGAMDAGHGQVGLGLLIFQDLAIIVMVMLVPMLSGTGGSALDIGAALGSAILIIIGVLLIARRLMPKLLEAVARTCSPELFLLTVIAVCFGTAYLTSLAGVSLSLGAFLAGLVVSESRFSEHAMSEIMPLRIIFSATFFVSVGMLLDISFLLGNLPLVLAILLLVLLIKVVTTGIAAKALGYSWPVVCTASLMLAQIGEFSFVLERAGREVSLFPAGMQGIGSQTFIAATVLLMVLTPVLTKLGERLAVRMERRKEHKVEQAMAAQVDQAAHEDHFADMKDHVIVAGYGQAARRLVCVLKQTEIPYVITTLSPEGAAEADAEKLPVMRGDAGKQRTLMLVGADRARMLVIADDDPARVHHIASVARTISSSIHIVVRTRYVSEVEELHAAGVDCVIAEEHESVVQLFAQVLRDYKIGEDRISEQVEMIRSHDYADLLEAKRRPQPKARALHKEVDVVGIDTERALSVDGKPSKGNCSHVNDLQSVVPRTNGCEECLRKGDKWVHLRLCMKCGHVGCCDSSPNKHASKHHHATGHPIVRSLEPGESWGWCYVDKEMIQ